ncbi:MAG TPA: ATP-binding protein, partial [Acidimicrobiales bacterium]|nr:ATP-binding protein [Acidimicrobiales bacterium]
AAAPTCVVVLTSAHPEGDLDAMRQLGGIAFLPKSVAPSRLGRELSALVAVTDPGLDSLHRAEIALPPSRESPRLARRFVEATLDGRGCAGLLDTVTLLVSEVVGNAVLHAGSEVELTVLLGPDRLRVEVSDRSTLVPHRREAAEGDLGGRGSGLIELLADAWGITGRPDGKTVWFELSVPGPDS